MATSRVLILILAGLGTSLLQCVSHAQVNVPLEFRPRSPFTSYAQVCQGGNCNSYTSNRVEGAALTDNIKAVFPAGVASTGYVTVTGGIVSGNISCVNNSCSGSGTFIQGIYADARPDRGIKVRLQSTAQASGTGWATYAYSDPEQYLLTGTPQQWAAIVIPKEQDTIVVGGKTYYWLRNTSIVAGAGGASGTVGTFSVELSNIRAYYIGNALAKADGNNGDNQTWLVNESLPERVSVKVSDGETGAPVVNTPISFKLWSPSNASSSLGTALTGADGIARKAVTLGSQSGTYRITATCPTNVCTSGAWEVTFTETAKTREEVVELRKLSGDGAMPVGKPAINPLRVQAINTLTNGVVAGQNVNFTIVSVPAGGGDAGPAAQSLLTNGNGVADYLLTLGKTEGDYVVKARCETCLANKEVLFSVKGVSDTDTHTATEGERVVPPPPPGNGALIISFHTRQMPANKFKAVTRADSRIGILTGLVGVEPAIQFSGSIAPRPNPAPDNNDYVWTGTAFPGERVGRVASVRFDVAGEYTLTLNIKNTTMSRTVRVKVMSFVTTDDFTAWARENPEVYPVVGGCAIDAYTLSASRYGNPDPANIGNAAKHAYWNACITNLINSLAANEATTAFELSGYTMDKNGKKRNDSPENETVMDLENNEAGRVIGGRLPYLVGQPLILGEVVNSAESGALTIMDDPNNSENTGLLQPSY